MVIWRLIEEVVNAGNLDAVDELLAPTFLNHNPLPGATPDRDGFKAAFRALYAAFPDLHAISSDLIAEGDRVVALRGFEGTHDGPFMGVPATGRRIVLDGIAVFHLDADPHPHAVSGAPVPTATQLQVCSGTAKRLINHPESALAGRKSGTRAELGGINQRDLRYPVRKSPERVASSRGARGPVLDRR